MVGTNSYITKLKAKLDRAINQRDHWKQLAENRNSIVVTEVCPESRSVEEYIIDADSVRASWRLIREYREQIGALRAENARLERLVSHWQGLTVTNRKVADDALAEMAEVRGREAVAEYQQLSRYGNWDRVDKAVYDLGKLGDTPEKFRALYTTPQPGPDVRALVSADDVRDACANAVSVFAEETNAAQCREVAEYMREVLLAQIARRQEQPSQSEGEL